ncbi:hypothetical protein WBN73_13920 [Paenarthrobacter sp. CCNWLY172]|uniref:hypothetical protein n=1 Tax=unclassified Paenarthrobacter TaxID=2634190 RepID=UPI003076C81B
MSTAATVKYMTRTVKTVRGMEERTKTKLEQEGWEFVSQTQGTFRTELSFRKPQPPMPWKMLGIGGGVVGIFIIIAIVMGAIEGGKKPAEPVAAGQTQTATPEASAPTQEALSQHASPPVVPSAVAPVATPITVDELLDMLNSGKMGDMEVGDRFELTGELVSSQYWTTGAFGEFNVLLKAKGGTNDIMVFIDEKETTSWRDGQKVHMIVEMGEATIKGETTNGWLRAKSAEIVP